MSVRVTSVEGCVALFDSTTGVAFGPVFADSGEATEFLAFLVEIGERDPRVIPARDLAELHAEWATERGGQNESRLAGGYA